MSLFTTIRNFVMDVTAWVLAIPMTFVILGLAVLLMAWSRATRFLWSDEDEPA